MPDRKDVVVLYIDEEDNKHEILLNSLELEEIKKLVGTIFTRKNSNVLVSSEKLKLLREDGTKWESKS